MTNPDMLSTREAPASPLAVTVSVSAVRLWITLDCGRMLGVPMDWLPALVIATPEQRANFEIIGGGAVLFWPDIDEYVAVKRLLYPGNAHGEDEKGLNHNPTGE